MVDVSHEKKSLISCLKETDTWYRGPMAQKACLVSCVMEKMLGVMSHGIKRLVSSFMETHPWYHVSWTNMLGIMSHGRNACYHASWKKYLVSYFIEKMLGIKSHGNTGLVSSFMETHS